MNKTIEELIKRRSIREFIDKEISNEDKQLIIEAAVNAPSAGNMQMYSIIDITEQDIKDKLAILCDNQPFIAKAKMILIFCADYQKWLDTFNDLQLEPRHLDSGDFLLSSIDATIAAQNSVTAAFSLGIGSCYIGDILENCEQVVELLQLPNYVIPTCMVVFGYADLNNLKGSKPKRAANEYVVFENKYKRLSSDELKAMYLSKQIPKDYKEWMKAFIARKYNSDFLKEMSRSVNKYLEKYRKD